MDATAASEVPLLCRLLKGIQFCQHLYIFVQVRRKEWPCTAQLEEFFI